MSVFLKWVMPIAFVCIGIAVLSGYILEQIPSETGLRPMIGVVVILLGVHRFVVSRMPSTNRDDRRRFGGERKRPWEPKS